MPNKTYDLKTNMQDFLDEITTISDKLVNDQIYRFNKENELAVAVDMLTLEDELDISLVKYCSKTGQPIGEYSVKEFEMMQRVLPNDKIKFYMERKSIEHVASYWIFTDGDSLKKLCEIDPYGYFVYAVCSIFGTYQRFLKKQKSTDDIHWYGKRRWLDKKIEVYSNIKTERIDLIVECNELMRRYLTLVQSSRALHLLKWSYTDIVEVTSHTARIQNLISDIRKNIGRVVKHEYREKRIKQHLTYADVVSVKDIYQGHSNFRLQRKPKEMSDVEMIMHELEAFMPDTKRMPILVGDRYEKPPVKKAKAHSGGFVIKSQGEHKPVDLGAIFGKKGN